jgi:hypothetical protein
MLPRCEMRVRWRRTPRLTSALRCCFFALLKSGRGTLRRTLGSRPRPTLPNLGEAEVVQALPTASRTGYTAPVAAHLARYTVICPTANTSRCVTSRPLFPRRNGPSARTASATKRMRQVSKTPSGQKGEQNRARDGTDNGEDQRLPVVSLQRPADRRHGAPVGEDDMWRQRRGRGAHDEAAPMLHDARPVVWKPRRTIAFLAETAFQGLPLQLLMGFPEHRFELVGASAVNTGPSAPALSLCPRC